MRNSEKTGVICCTYLTIWMHEVIKSLSDETMRSYVPFFAYAICFDYR